MILDVKLCHLLYGIAGKNKQRHLYPIFPQFNGLADTAHTKVICTARLQLLSARYDSVSIGICFDCGHHFHIRSHHFFKCKKIDSHVIQTDIQPAGTFQVISVHFLTLPYFLFSVIINQTSCEQNIPFCLRQSFQCKRDAPDIAVTSQCSGCNTFLSF